MSIEEIAQWCKDNSLTFHLMVSCTSWTNDPDFVCFISSESKGHDLKVKAEDKDPSVATTKAFDLYRPFISPVQDVKNDLLRIEKQVEEAAADVFADTAEYKDVF